MLRFTPNGVLNRSSILAPFARTVARTVATVAANDDRSAA
jgi:hypothetical protein